MNYGSQRLDLEIIMPNLWYSHRFNGLIFLYKCFGNGAEAVELLDSKMFAFG